MSDKIYDESALENAVRAKFGVDVDILQTILYRSPVSQMAEATLFLTNKKQLYLYIDSKSKIALGDIKKLVIRMGLKAEIFFPPKGQSRYFEDLARVKFNEVFPGRKQVSDDDLTFYRTLVQYSPALVLISEVKDGVVYQFDADSATGWRAGARFTYRRIKTS
jgi:hypothetical protein